MNKFKLFFVTLCGLAFNVIVPNTSSAELIKLNSINFIGSNPNGRNSIHDIAVDPRDNSIIATGKMEMADGSVWAVKYDNNLETISTTNLPIRSSPYESIYGPYRCAIDSQGNIFILAKLNFNGWGYGSTHYMIYKYSSDLSTILSLAIYDKDSLGDYVFYEPSDIAVDHNDNVIITGSRKTINMSDYTKTSERYVTVKYTNDLTGLDEAIEHDYDLFKRAASISVDSNNNIYITGTEENKSSGFMRVRTIKYNSNLNIATSVFHDFSGLSSQGKDIAIDSDNNVIVTGTVSDKIFTIKCDSNLNQSAIAQPDIKSSNSIVCTDSNNNIYVKIGDDGSLFKYSSNLDLIDTTSKFDNPYSKGIALDTNNNVFLARKSTAVQSGNQHWSIDKFLGDFSNPTVQGITPNIGKPGETINVIITGNDFYANALAEFNRDITVNSRYTVDMNTINADITISPSASNGLNDLTVTNIDNQSTSLPNAFNIVYDRPMISAIEPSSALIGETVDIVITGNYFYTGALVTFDNLITVNTVEVMNNNTINANLTVTDSASVGFCAIAVANTDNQYISMENAFRTDYPQPTISNITPHNAIQGETLQVTINGDNFRSGATVNFSGDITVNSREVTDINIITANITIAQLAVIESCSITVTNDDAQSNTLTNAFSINPPPSLISVDTAEFNFTLYELDTNMFSNSFILSHTGETNETLEWSIDENADWLWAELTSGSLETNDSVEISFLIDPSILELGTYTETLTIRNTNTTESKEVPITITINQVLNGTMDISPASLIYSGTVGQSYIMYQNIIVANTGNSESSLTFMAQSNVPWIHFPTGPSRDVDGGIFAMIPTAIDMDDFKDLPAGTHNGIIAILSFNATNSPQFINVTLTINEQPDPVISVDRDTLVFSVSDIDWQDPQPQTVTLTNTGPQYSVLDWSVISLNSSWLSVSPRNGTLESNNNQSISFSVDIPPFIGLGMHNDTITIRDNNSPAITKEISVTLNIISGPKPEISFNMHEIFFNPTAGDTGIISKDFVVSNTGNEGTYLYWESSVHFTWLTLSKTSGRLGTNEEEIITASVDLSMLADTERQYRSNIIFRHDETNVYLQKYLSVSVSFNPRPDMNIDKTELSFSAIKRQGNPDSQNFSIQNNGTDGSLLNWSIAEHPDWLRIDGITSPLQKDETVTLRVSANADILDAGTYETNLIITDSVISSINKQISINFTLDPPATITLTNYISKQSIKGNYEITWDSERLQSSDQLKIMYSDNDGASYDHIIVESTEHDGIYSWDTKTLYIPQCKIRIEKAGDPSIFDESNTSFVIDNRIIEEEAQNDDSESLAKNPGEAKVQGGPKGYINPSLGHVAKIHFHANEPGTVEIKIYTVRGQLVWETSKDTNGSGDFITWACQNSQDNIVGSGIYIVHVSGPGISQTKKVAIIK